MASMLTYCLILHKLPVRIYSLSLCDIFYLNKEDMKKWIKRSNCGENSLRFSLSEKVLISHSFPKNILPRYKILGWQFFCLSAWRILCHFLSSSPVSDEKSVVIEMVFPLQVMYHFLMGAFNALSLSSAFRSLS